MSDLRRGIQRWEPNYISRSSAQDYFEHLSSKGKGEWPRIAEGIWHSHIEPAFGKWSLA